MRHLLIVCMDGFLPPESYSTYFANCAIKKHKILGGPCRSLPGPELSMEQKQTAAQQETMMVSQGMCDSVSRVCVLTPQGPVLGGISFPVQSCCGLQGPCTCQSRETVSRAPSLCIGHTRHGWQHLGPSALGLHTCLSSGLWM